MPTKNPFRPRSNAVPSWLVTFSLKLEKHRSQVSFISGRQCRSSFPSSHSSYANICSTCVYKIFFLPFFDCIYLGALRTFHTCKSSTGCVCVCVLSMYVHVFALFTVANRIAVRISRRRAACNWQRMQGNTRRIRNYLLMFPYRRSRL